MFRRPDRSRLLALLAGSGDLFGYGVRAIERVPGPIMLRYRRTPCGRRNRLLFPWRLRIVALPDEEGGYAEHQDKKHLHSSLTGASFGPAPGRPPLEKEQRIFSKQREYESCIGPCASLLFVPMERRGIEFGIILGALLLCLAEARAETPLQLETEQFFPLPLDGSLTIDNIDGSIHIFGWYEPRVRVAALRQAYSEARLHQITVETRPSRSSLVVRTIIPPAHGLFADRSGTVHYTITAPETAHFKLKLSKGEISLQGLRGGQAEVDFENGRLFVVNCYAQVRARSINGAMDLFFDWWENLPGAIDLFLQHGRIGARLPAAARFHVDARTAQGGIHNGFGLRAPTGPGSGQMLEGATAADPPLSLGLRIGGGNITIDAFR